jgi:3-oxoacyl-[acyl-carrier protein] reductase
LNGRKIEDQKKIKEADMQKATPRTAIITGASKGIGKATAILLGANQINVVVNYREDAAGARDAVQAIEKQGGRAIAVQADVSAPPGVTTLFDAAIDQFGQVDILVNNAGVLLTKPIADITEADFDDLFAVNVKGVFFAMKAAAARLADNGRVINLSSTTTRALFPNYGLYSASKAAVEQATRVFAKEMGSRGITVNAVMPGPTNTQLMQDGKTDADRARLAELAAFNRLGEPEDIARVILFLVSDEAGWVSAQVIGVNGGFI